MHHPAIKSVSFTPATQTYTFRVDGKPDFRCDAPNNLAAYSVANAHFGSLPQGAWMDSFGVRTYRWALGSFFD